MAPHLSVIVVVLAKQKGRDRSFPSHPRRCYHFVLGIAIFPHFLCPVRLWNKIFHVLRMNHHPFFMLFRSIPVTLVLLTGLLLNTLSIKSRFLNVAFSAFQNSDLFSSLICSNVF